MNTEKRLAGQQSIDAPSVAEPLGLTEAQGRAWLISLCRKLQSVNELHEMRPLDRGLAVRVDVVAEMIGELAGLQIEEIYELFDRADGTAEGLMQQLEPLPAEAYRAWLAVGGPRTRPANSSARMSAGEVQEGPPGAAAPPQGSCPASGRPGALRQPEVPHHASSRHVDCGGSGLHTGQRTENVDGT